MSEPKSELWKVTGDKVTAATKNLFAAIERRASRADLDKANAEFYAAIAQHEKHCEVAIEQHLAAEAARVKAANPSRVVDNVDDFIRPDPDPDDPPPPLTVHATVSEPKDKTITVHPRVIK